MLLSRDEDYLHRPTIAWIDRLSATDGVSRLAEYIRDHYRGREADGIYAVLGAIRYVPDAVVAGALREYHRQVEPSAEVLQSPRLLLRTRVGDCDDQTVLAAALARALNLPYRYVLHRRLDRPGYHHVYLIVQDGRGWRAVDRVWGRGPGTEPPGVKVYFEPTGGRDMVREILVPLPTTSREPVELGQAAVVPPKESWWKTSPIGQALTAGTAGLLSAFTQHLSAKIEGRGAVPAAPAAPAAAPAAPSITPVVGAVLGGGLLLALTFLRRR